MVARAFLSALLMTSSKVSLLSLKIGRVGSHLICIEVARLQRSVEAASDTLTFEPSSLRPSYLHIAEAHQLQRATQPRQGTCSDKSRSCLAICFNGVLSASKLPQAQKQQKQASRHGDSGVVNS